jgi:hypothetical protein
MLNILHKLHSSILSKTPFFGENIFKIIISVLHVGPSEIAEALRRQELQLPHVPDDLQQKVGHGRAPSQVSPKCRKFSENVKFIRPLVLIDFVTHGEMTTLCDLPFLQSLDRELRLKITFNGIVHNSRSYKGLVPQ